MAHLISRWFGRERGRRAPRVARPEVMPLEDRQLLSAFARSFEGGPANDMAVYRPGNGTWYIDKAATGFNTSKAVAVQWGNRGDIPVPNSDYFGNGHADLAVFRPSNGTWYIKDPQNGATLAVQWGNNGDVPLGASDYFGNGHADLAVFRPSNGTWYIKDPRTGQSFWVQWGAAGDVPIARANFDGTVRADIAVYRPSDQTWHVLTSATGYNPVFAIQTQWGAPGDVPIFNSDFLARGYDDFAVYRPSNGTWYVRDPYTGATTVAQWGTPGDVPLANSNFFGDGRADFAVYRPSNGTWYVKDPRNSVVLQVQWGLAGDEPLANADFDGDGRADVAVFRPSDSTWHVLTSSTGFSKASSINRQWGAAGDMPIPGPSAPEPITDTAPGATFRSFLGNPLFASNGPIPEDVIQGGAGDCSLLATLVGLAKLDPNQIRRMIADNGDGTYTVDFRPAGYDEYIRVDASLPVDSGGNLIYAKLGHQNCLWVPLVEKAWTFGRPLSWGATTDPSIGTYGMIEGGGPNELWNTLNIPFQPGTTATALGDWLNGKEVIVLTDPQTVSTGLLAEHYYYVDSVSYVYIPGLWIPLSYTLRNPHGGSQSTGVHAEFVTITAAQFDASFIAEASAYV